MNDSDHDRGQNLRVPFLRTVLPPEVEESAQAMAANGETKALISPPPRRVSAPTFTFRSVHDSDHGSVVRISVGQSSVLKHDIYYIIYVAQFFPYQDHVKNYIHKNQTNKQTKNYVIFIPMPVHPKNSSCIPILHCHSI